MYFKYIDAVWEEGDFLKYSNPTRFKLLEKKLNHLLNIKNFIDKI